MDQSAVSISDSKVPTMMTTSVRFGLVACLVGFLFVACGGNPTVVGGKDDYDAPIGTAGEAPDGGPGIDINVGGEKVYPQEVEDAILGFDEVADCMVFGEKNYLTGNIVCAIVKLKMPENTEGFALRLRKFLRARLPTYKVPVKIKTDDSLAASDRFKKVRQPHE